MNYVIDRWEGETAVCEREDGVMVRLSKGDLPTEAKEGDGLREEDGIFVIVAPERRRRIERKMKGLWKK